MATRPNAFTDAVVYTPRLTQTFAWFNSLDPQWVGWDKDGETEYGKTGAFRHGVVGSSSFLDLPGDRSLVWVRMQTGHYAQLMAIGLPSFIEVLATADPYAPLPSTEAPTRDEVLQARDVFTKLKANPTAVGYIRSFHPKTRQTPDGSVTQSLRFAHGGEAWARVPLIED